MRKNGSRLISFSQYRTADLFLFVIIAGLAELFSYAATIWFPEEAIFSFSFALPIILIVMMRWGWPSVFYAAGSAVLYCALRSLSWQYYLSYAVGSAAVIICLVYLLPVGKERVAKSWYLSVVFVILAWVAVVLVRSVMLTVTGVYGFVAALSMMAGYADCGLLSLAMGIIAILIVRKFDGLFEDQKAYLIRLGKLSEEKRRVDTFGERLEEIDEENLSILNHNDELY